jgi:hypothetical protein
VTRSNVGSFKVQGSRFNVRADSAVRAPDVGSWSLNVMHSRIETCLITSNVQRSTSNFQLPTLNVECWTLSRFMQRECSSAR